MPPVWLVQAAQELREKYPGVTVEPVCKAVQEQEFVIICLDWPSKSFDLSPGKTLTNFELHLQDRLHSQRFQRRLQNKADQWSTFQRNVSQLDAKLYIQIERALKAGLSQPDSEEVSHRGTYKIYDEDYDADSDESIPINAAERPGVPDSLLVADSEGTWLKKRRGRAAPPGPCHSRKSAQSPEWHREPDGARTLCNTCGLSRWDL